MLKQSRHFSSILSVAIAYREEVAMLEPHDVRRGDISILICLVWIMSCNTTLRSKTKFSYHITYFAFRGFLCSLLVSTGLIRSCPAIIILISLSRWGRITLLPIFFI